MQETQTSLPGSWSKFVKWTPPGINHKSSNLSQSIHLWFLFNKHNNNATNTFFKKVLCYMAHMIQPQGKDERKNILWQMLIVFAHVTTERCLDTIGSGGGSAVRTTQNSHTISRALTCSVGPLPSPSAMLCALSGTHSVCHLNRITS